MSGRLIVISGPSGVGKGTLIRGALAELPELTVATSATTRPRRPGEEDGREYHFLGPEEFERRVAGNGFLEHVSYAGHRYGTLRSEVDGHLQAGRSVVLEVEVQGARAIKRLRPDAVLVFIAPPTLAALAERLRLRRTDSDEEIAARIAIAERELDARPEFDHVITNDSVPEATAQLVAAIRDALAEEAG